MTRTRRLYHEDPELRTFEAAVLSVVGGTEGPAEVVLDQTAFYPTGGGQPHDVGTLGGVAVLEVLEDGDTIRHRLALRPSGDRLVGQIDWRRRTDHRQQHSGQHILSRAFLDTVGAATVGFHLGETTSTIDLDRDVDEAGLDAAERLANDVVLADHLLEARWFDSPAELPSGLRKEVEVEGPLRVIAIGTFDATLCCGTHCARSGQVGLVKLLRTERRRGGVRVEFVCGARALEDYRRRHRALRAAALVLTTEELRVPERVEGMLAEQKLLRTRLEAAEEAVRDGRIEAWAAETMPGPFVGLLEDERAAWLSPMAGVLAERRGEPVLLASQEREEARVALAVPAGSDAHAGEILRALLDAVAGRGGGSERLAQGKLPRNALPELIERWRQKGTHP